MKSRLTRFAHVARRSMALVQSAVADFLATLESPRYERVLVPIPMRPARPIVRRRQAWPGDR